MIKHVNSKIKLIGLFVVFTIVFTLMSGSVFATDVAVQSNESETEQTIIYDEQTGEALVLVNYSVSYEEDCMIIERQYRSIDLSRAASGSGTFRNDKEHIFPNNFKSLLYWVSGYFTWNSSNDTATVSSAKKGYSGESSSNVSNESFNYKSNQGGIWPSKKYAFVQYTFRVAMFAGPQDFSVYVDVNVDGVSSTR